MTSSNIVRKTVLLTVAFLTLSCTGAVAGTNFATESIELTKSKSMVLNSQIPIKRLSVADPEIAEILLLSPNQIYLTGKAPGATNLTLWGHDGRVSHIYDISVTPDIAQLKQMLHRVLPDERNLKVMAAGESITLSGVVSSTGNLSTALDLAELYAPEKVTNLMSVGGVHQVMLEVKVAEMHRNVLERLGVDLAFASNGNLAYTLLNNLISLDNQNPALTGGTNTPGLLYNTETTTAIGRTAIGSTNITGFLDVLKQNGLVKVLAEPTLICRSGEEAQFLAGGEIPVPIPQGLGTVAIEYKPYGVALAFTPVVLSQGRISLKVFPEVSELDYANALNISGFTIPALTSRRASTTVELGDGQSFAIAGLLQDEIREDIKKYPGLGDIPILGTLFRSSNFQKSETELVIIVTPHLAKPMEVVDGSLPTDHFVEPSELEFFIYGKMEGERDPDLPAPAKTSVRPASTVPAAGGATPSGPDAGMEGDFGHILKP
ncbi:type II and III secretion system protein family protein [Desulfovibrio ferrophilus]|uniref:Type II and III secretion system protein n=1 Tax=Desulfovibrio ferrophilus TaxID=241368 RepID=A0A2Z6AY04_9BACT|nr:type II and III secretion system protein family protein [Desulfovibrio ferrophilus]BBD08121.1 type II and III secretion system protein [Desulfovibrio ferrophilus]